VHKCAGAGHQGGGPNSTHERGCLLRLRRNGSIGVFTQSTQPSSGDLVPDELRQAADGGNDRAVCFAVAERKQNLFVQLQCLPPELLRTSPRRRAINNTELWGQCLPMILWDTAGGPPSD
jgi:hypothetical protein